MDTGRNGWLRRGNLNPMCDLGQFGALRAVEGPTMIPKPKPRGRDAKAKEWLKFRRRYLKIVRPDDFGYYKCALCHMVVNEKDVTLDHIIPRSRRPDLVFEFSNIQLTHYSCNAEKGSHVERA